MDFFAQAYNRSESPPPLAKHSPVHSPRSPSEGACRGYGSESNAHLRRASSGLESDVPRHSFPHFQHGMFGHLLHHHDHDSDQDHPVTTVPENSPMHLTTPTTVGTTPVHKNHDFSYFSLGRHTGTAGGGGGGQEHRTENSAEANRASSTRSPVPLGSPVSSPGMNRRTSVSNPCLLNHVNLSGGGVVRPPTMPQSVSYSMNEGDPLSPSLTSPRPGNVL
ncbi:hypothetical protein BGZ99_007216 [Dissophora globulifera]|uniref:Uncharacterized protein n=1 Tax=Dissophora globulifera TaxID=979702 RepID=A0A9P6RRV6_9FUNG|nr:hypothetical protein BGZ99_007216 [Dissophora globulifera]